MELSHKDNLFLHYFENKYITSLIDSGNIQEAKKLSGTFRYLDDLLGLNDEGLIDHIHNLIYPGELKLSRTDNEAKSAECLDMNVDTEPSLNLNFLTKEKNFLLKL